MLRKGKTMGVLIFTHDAAKYRVGHYVEGEGVICAPNVPDLTVIAHIARPSAKDMEGWLDVVSYRMVVVCKTPPKMDDERVIYDHRPSKREDFMPAIKASLTWSDRLRSWAQVRKVPYPLLAAFMRENDRNIEMWRSAALGFQWVPQEMQVAALHFHCKPVRRPTFPKKAKKADEDPLPHGFRESDVYARQIAEIDHSVGNNIRTIAPDTMPKKAKKRKQTKQEWL